MSEEPHEVDQDRSEEEDDLLQRSNKRVRYGEEEFQIPLQDTVMGEEERRP